MNQSLATMSPIYTQTNLHPDEVRARLYAVNFQQAGLLPAGTEVECTLLNAKSFCFRVVSTGKIYTYLNHKQAAESFETHLGRYFGPSWDPEKITGLSEKDQEGIRVGRVETGMTREGVILAIGYPPRLENPDLNAVRWRYWIHRFSTFIIEFSRDDTVSMIHY